MQRLGTLLVLFVFCTLTATTGAQAQSPEQEIGNILGQMLGGAMRNAQQQQQQKQQQQYYKTLTPYINSCYRGDVRFCDYLLNANIPDNLRSSIAQKRDELLQAQDQARQDTAAREEEARRERERQAANQRNLENQRAAQEQARQDAERLDNEKKQRAEVLTGFIRECGERSVASCDKALNFTTDDRAIAEIVAMRKAAIAPLGIPALASLNDLPLSTIVMGLVATLLALTSLYFSTRRRSTPPTLQPASERAENQRAVLTSTNHDEAPLSLTSMNRSFPESTGGAEAKSQIDAPRPELPSAPASSGIRTLPEASIYDAKEKHHSSHDHIDRHTDEIFDLPENEDKPQDTSSAYNATASAQKLAHVRAAEGSRMSPKVLGQNAGSLASAKLFAVLGVILGLIGFLIPLVGPIFVTPLSIVFVCLSLYNGDFKNIAIYTTILNIVNLFVSPMVWISFASGVQNGGAAAALTWFDIIGSIAMIGLIMRNVVK